ncbi:thioredoxin fold domain-containing protein [Burkholderia glumae]|nr:thioredoxin fold domain-containing protein [Burkholderia glumae]PJO20603.1 disulfide isomerase [Burkholderia glumae AU6208]QGA41018.1 thioredoxin fold domain-containing protein [Burkholderia glumae]QHE14089.1 thioredoxin fold domain-containing protein [Burkholderia glumae AU6208]UVS98918.1 disulfide isomerase [Burkholderia glumae]
MAARTGRAAAPRAPAPPACARMHPRRRARPMSDLRGFPLHHDEDFMKTRISIALAAAALTVGLTSRAAEPPPALTDAQMLRVQAAPAIVEGASGARVKSTLYVFMDPNCIYCHLMWKALRPYEAAGLQVHWIPLAFLKPDSAGKAAALLKAPDGGAALLDTLETKYSEKDESGGIAPLTVVPADAKAKLDANAAMFKALGFDGTPTVLFRSHDGKWLGLDGLPRLSMLPGMLNMVEQPITDPELQRYR